METRDLMIIGLIILLLMQQHEIWTIKKDRFHSKVATLALMRWLDEVHKIKPPNPDTDTEFAKILFSYKDDDYIKKHIND